MSSFSESEEYLKNLKMKAQYEQILANSWGSEKKRQVLKPIIPPTVQQLTEEPGKLLKKQNQQQEMILDWQESQKRPVRVGDAFFQFHPIGEPVLKPELPLDVGHNDQYYNERLESAREDLDGLEAVKQDLRQRIIRLGEDRNIFIADMEETIKRLEDELVNVELKLADLENRYTSASHGEKKSIHQEIKGVKKRQGGLWVEIATARRDMQTYKEGIDDEEKALKREIIMAEQNKLPIKDAYQRIEREKIMNRENLKDREIQNNEIIKENEDKIKAYDSELKFFNKGFFDPRQRPEESQDDYLVRLNQMGENPQDNQIGLDRATMKNIDKFRENLQYLIRDQSLIEEVLNKAKVETNIGVEGLFQFNKIFEPFKRDFFKLYGMNNKSIKGDELVSIITEYVNDGIMPSSRFKAKVDSFVHRETMGKIPENALVEMRHAGLAVPQIPEPEPLRTGVIGQAIFHEPERVVPRRMAPEGTGDEDIFFIENQGYADLSAALGFPPQGVLYRLTDRNFLQIIYPRSNKVISALEPEPLTVFAVIRMKTPGMQHRANSTSSIFMSKTGEPDSFKDIKLSSAERAGLKNKEHQLEYYLITYLEIPESIFKQLFENPRTGALQPKEDILRLFNQLGVETIQQDAPMIGKSQPTGKRTIYMYGFGVGAEKVPELIQFGHINLYLKKLYFKNILSIAKQNGQKVAGFKNTPVSDEFVKIVMKISKNGEPTAGELHSLKLNEHELLDNLLHVSGLHKKNISGSASNTIKKIKEKLELTEGEIEAGNNNPELKKQLYDLLFKLVNFDVITDGQARKHYKEIVNNYF